MAFQPPDDLEVGLADAAASEPPDEEFADAAAFEPPDEGTLGAWEPPDDVVEAEEQAVEAHMVAREPRKYTRFPAQLGTFWSFYQKHCVCVCVCV